MEIIKNRTPEFNKFVGKPNQSYSRAEKLLAMQEAIRRGGGVGNDEMTPEIIVDMFTLHADSASLPVFEKWGERFHDSKNWQLVKIVESINTSDYFLLSRIASYIKNNLPDEKI